MYDDLHSSSTKKGIDSVQIQRSTLPNEMNGTHSMWGPKKISLFTIHIHSGEHPQEGFE